MIRRRGASRRRYAVTIALRIALANMRCGDADAARAEWERFWGGPDEGRSAFGALRDLPPHPTLGSCLGNEPGDSYEQWFLRLARHADEHEAQMAAYRQTLAERNDDVMDEDPDPDEDAVLESGR